MSSTKKYKDLLSTAESQNPMDVSLNPLQALSITGKSLRALNTHKILKMSLSYFSTAYYSHLAVPSSPAGPLSMAEWCWDFSCSLPLSYNALKLRGWTKPELWTAFKSLTLISEDSSFPLLARTKNPKSLPKPSKHPKRNKKGLLNPHIPFIIKLTTQLQKQINKDFWSSSL